MKVVSMTGRRKLRNSGLFTVLSLFLALIALAHDGEARGQGTGLGIQTGTISGVSLRTWFPARWGLEGDLWLGELGAKVLIRVAEDSWMAVYWGGGLGIGFAFTGLEGFRVQLIVGTELTPQAVRSLAFNLEVGIGAMFGQFSSFHPTAGLGVHWYF